MKDKMISIAAPKWNDYKGWAGVLWNSDVFIGPVPLFKIFFLLGIIF